MRRWTPLLLLTGCGYDLEGWWDLVRWDVERGAEQLTKTDAGFMLWQEDPDRGFYLSLSYAYDPDAFELVPLAEPDTTAAQPTDSTYGTYTEEDPILRLSIPQPGGVPWPGEMFMDKWGTSRMVLRSVSDTDVEYVWTFER